MIEPEKTMNRNNEAHPPQRDETGSNDYSDRAQHVALPLRSTTRVIQCATLAFAVLATGWIQASVQSHPSLIELLKYDRAQVIAHHQAWRLVTASWVHLSWTHWAVNLSGACAVMALFARLASPLRLWRDVAVIGALHLVVLMLVFGDVSWVAGLSGALHGVFAKNALTLSRAPASNSDGWLTGPRYGIVLLAGLGCKLVLDAALSVGGISTIGTDLGSAGVAWQAHCAGAAVGAVWGYAARKNRLRRAP